MQCALRMLICKKLPRTRGGPCYWGNVHSRATSTWWLLGPCLSIVLKWQWLHIHTSLALQCPSFVLTLRWPSGFLPHWERCHYLKRTPSDSFFLPEQCQGLPSPLLVHVDLANTNSSPKDTGSPRCHLDLLKVYSSTAFSTPVLGSQCHYQFRASSCP